MEAALGAFAEYVSAREARAFALVCRAACVAMCEVTSSRRRSRPCEGARRWYRDGDAAVRLCARCRAVHLTTRSDAISRVMRRPSGWLRRKREAAALVARLQYASVHRHTILGGVEREKVYWREDVERLCAE